MKNKKLSAISTPIEFQKQYLSDTDSIVCPFCFDSEKDARTSFLQIAPLEQIKNLHKHESFESVRRKFYTIVLLTSGSVKETIGHRTYELEKNALYFIAENQLHTIHSWSGDVKGYHCIFDAEYFLLCLKNQVKLSKYPFFQVDNSPYVILEALESEHIQSLLKTMMVEYAKQKTVNDDLLVRLYLNILLIESERIYKSKQTVEVSDLSRKEQLVTQFKLLVSESFITLRQVSEYAERLFVHPQYLNDTFKKIVGITASNYISKQLITEAKAHLIQTDESISEIADYLNFSDQSYFARFFKKHAGVTPSQFREKHGH